MSDRISVPERQFQEETEDFLTLRLCSNYHKGDKSSGSASKAESEVGESGFSGSNGEPSRRRRRKQREFICKFCKKNFKSGQALGGHLNAHRGERDLIRKMDQEMQQQPASSADLDLSLSLSL